MELSGMAWALDPLWDDGLAEVARYRAQRTVYGHSRDYEATLITVKEDLNCSLYVKSDTPFSDGDILPVLKLNVVASIPTENYFYHYLTSVFVNRRNPMSLVKLSNGSQEWCGNTFKLLRNRGGKTELDFHSYFDKEGDGTLPLGLKTEDLVEDQLPLSLRCLPFQEGYRLKTRILDSLTTNRLGSPELADSEIQVIGRESIQEEESWRVDVRRKHLQQSYWFSQAYPNILLKSDSSDGRHLLLLDKVRRKYW